MTASGMRSHLFRLALLVGGVLLGALLGELGLRVLGLPKSGPFLQEFRGDRFKIMSYDENPSGALDLDLSDAGIRQAWASHLYDPADFERSWKDTPHGVAFEFNALGFREREFRPRTVPRGQPDSVRRIAIVGDSFTVGHGLPDEGAYPRRLETRFHEAGSSHVEVYNLGQGDTDLKQILRVAGFALKRLDPDVLVYGYFLNDPLRTLTPYGDIVMHDMLDAGWIKMQQTRTTTRIGQSDRGVSRVLDLIQGFQADRNVTHSTVDWYQRLHQPAAWRPTLEQIDRLSIAAASRGIRFLVVLLPLPFEISGDHPFAEAHRNMTDGLKAKGVEVVDALPSLRGYSDQELRLHPRDRHPSPLYADRVSELLAQVLSSPSPSPSPGPGSATARTSLKSPR